MYYRESSLSVFSLTEEVDDKSDIASSTITQDNQIDEDDAQKLLELAGMHLNWVGKVSRSVFAITTHRQLAQRVFKSGLIATKYFPRIPHSTNME